MHQPIAGGNQNRFNRQNYMKLQPSLLLCCVVACVLPSCAVVPPGPSIASLGAGSDSAYLNANRGRADAQITADQAKQYSRQRQQVSEEMRLEEEKKNATYNSWHRGLSLFGDVARIGGAFIR